MNNDGKVYVVQESSAKNFLPAEKFGQIRVILTGPDLELGLAHCKAKLRDVLGMFNFQQDYLVLVGDPIYIGLAMVYAMESSEDYSINVLRWNRDTYSYTNEVVQP